MKKIGLIGGLGPEATVDYYKEIHNLFKKENVNLNYPEIIIYSVNMAHFLGLLEKGKLEEATSYIVEKINSLKAAGADFAAITANTPHVLYPEISGTVSLPMISIVEATRREAQKLGVKKPVLFGTGFTMNADFYQKEFSKFNMEIIVPDEEGRTMINTKLFTEIELGIFKEDTRQELLDLVKKMIHKNGIDGLILGCTELPLILKEDSYFDIPVINTTRVHVKEIVDYCKGE